ncbi:MAG: TonB-dependent receptor domain-containing protein [Flavisolibacter sp.]
MKRVIVVALMLWVMCYQVQAQQSGEQKKGEGVITGKVMDSSASQPLEYATVSLYAKGNSSPIDGTTTNNTGHFQLLNVAPGIYSVVAEFIGYSPVTINISVSEKNNIIDLKTVSLHRKAESLQTVVVTAQGKVIENKIDKMIFNAEKDLTSQSGVATDVLKKVPQVSVDVDGNVELAGNSSVRFLINGKPSSAFGSNIADVLQSIPASQIKSIEVITNPGAKYDAQGIGGIINIILKKSTARGINGNLSLTAGTRMDNGSFNFNARKGKLAFNAFISGNFRPYITSPSVYDRVSLDSAERTVLLHQNGNSRFKRGGYQSGMGLDYSINDKNSITASVAYDHFGFNSSGLINQLQTTSEQNGSLLSSIATVNHTNNQFQFNNVDAGLSYKKTFSKEDEELDIAANSSWGRNNSSSSNLQYYLPQDSLYYGTNSTNPGREKESELTVDFTDPLKKELILGFGGKIGARGISSDANVTRYDPDSKYFVPDPYLTNSLDYHQRVYAVYSELSFPVGKLFDAKVGGRYERTEINSDYSNAQQKTDIPGYNTFVPSIFFTKKLGENQRLKLSFSKRIERPDYRDLNPFINTSDPKNITAGNPYLLPEIGNRYELGYSIDFDKLGSFMVSSFYRTSNQDIQSYLVYYPSLLIGDSTYTNVSVSTRENIGLERDFGLSLFADLHFSSKLNLRANVFAFHRHTLNAIDPGYNATSFNFRSNLNASYQFASTLAAEFFGNFNSARHEVQGTYPSFTTYSFAVRKQFWNKKGSLALTAVNPFNEYVNQKTLLHGPGFETTSLRKIPFRSFGLNFTWKFGKLEFKKEKEESTPNMGLPE